MGLKYGTHNYSVIQEFNNKCRYILFCLFLLLPYSSIFLSFVQRNFYLFFQWLNTNVSSYKFHVSMIKIICLLSVLSLIISFFVLFLISAFVVFRVHRRNLFCLTQNEFISMAFFITHFSFFLNHHQRPQSFFKRMLDVVKTPARRSDTSLNHDSEHSDDGGYGEHR